MKSLLIRNVSPETVQRLKANARANHRSLQGELHALIEAGIGVPDSSESEFELRTVRTDGTQRWTREEMYAD